MQSQFDYKPYKLKDFSAPEPVKEEGAFVPFFQPEPLLQEKPESELPAEPEAPPPPPSFDEEQLEVARQEAFEEGRRAGRREVEEMQDLATQHQQQQITALLSTLLGRFEQEVAEIAQHREKQRQEVSTLVLLLARKLAGNALTAQPLGAVEPMIQDCLVMLAGEKNLGIAVAPTLVKPLQDYVAVHRRPGQELEVISDPALQPGDCRIQWPSGKAERNHEAVWREIERIVTRSMSAPDVISEV